MRHDLPTGTVTLLFTDVEGSTRLLHELGAEGYATALAEHRRVLREAFAAHGGVEVDTQGDAFFAAFPTAPAGLAAAAQAVERLAAGPIRVRIGLHTGTPHLTEEGYVGADVHRAARIAAAGHGGQVLVSAATAALAGTDGLRDLGEHWLKDLAAPERVYQLGGAEFPRLASLNATNLPVATTPFLGRERELADVTALLSRDDVRLLTLTGPGGTGKTRLAAQAAAHLVERYPAGVWWVQLATLRDRELVLETAATAVGASEGLAEHIADRTMLLVFDNFEQVVDAGPDVAGVLAACPNLAVLVTSREPLRVSGEHEYAVPPLAHEEAVELFVTRATAVKADFDADEAVPEICRRLDELPLAVELAAARVKALSPRQILARLEQRLPLLTGGARDLPERQRTLRAAIAWSHELLTRDEQRLFARVAVFSGGCTLEAAEKVAGADVDALQSLVDKSLLRQTDERFWMLETIREFAAGELGGSGEDDEVRRRHADYFLELAEAAGPHLRDWWSSGGADWLDRLEREHANFRAALDHLEAAGGGELALRLVGSISEAWELRGHLAEARRRLESALAADERPTHPRAKALNQAATIAVSAGDAAAGRRLAEEALDLHRTLDDPWGTANSTFVLGYALAEESDMARARELFDEAARRFDEARDEHYALLARRALAWACYELGDLDRARRLHEENLERARALPNDFIVASTLSALAGMAVDDGRIDDAVPLLEESQRLYRELGDPVDVAVNLCRFARALAAADKAVPAAELLATYEALCAELGASVPWAARSNEETLSAIRGLLDEATFDEAWERGRALDAEAAVALALEALRPDGVQPTRR